MKFNFKKIASVLAGTVMLTSTIAFAAAANYPAPFSATGGAVVYGTNAAKTDVVAAFQVESSVKPTSTTATTATTTGETYPLFTSASKLYVGNALNTVKTSLSSTNLPTVLADGTFNGDVSTKYSQKIVIGSTPSLQFGNMPTTDDSAVYGLVTSSSTSTPIYNLTVTFDSPVNFTNTKSQNRQITLFGQKYTVGSDTSSTKLVLLNSATTLSFDSTGTTSGQVTVGGATYTVELSNVDTDGATLTVTAADGTSESDTISKGGTGTINGLSIGVVSASSSNQKFTASIVVGSDKLTFATDGSPVKYGDNDKTMDGTASYITGSMGAAKALVVSIAAKGDDFDALRPGQSFTDPVFKTIKLDFSAGMSVSDNDTARETLQVTRSADDKLQLKGLLQDSSGSAVSIPFVKNQTYGLELQDGDQGKNISVMEGQAIFYNEFAVVPGSDDKGVLVKVGTISNVTGTTPSDDSITLTDVATGDPITVTIDSEGVAEATIGDKPYYIVYSATPSSSVGAYIKLYSGSSIGASRFVYPTMVTPNGNAEVALYEQETITLSSGVTSLLLPNGDGTTSVSIAAGNYPNQWTIGSGTLWTNATTSGVLAKVGQFTYSFNATTTTNQTKLSIVTPTNGGATASSIYANPGVIVFEGKGEASTTDYEGMLLTTSPGTKVSAGTVYFTSTKYTGTNPDNSDLAYSADNYGSIVTTDSSADQTAVSVSIPAEIIYGNVYMGSTSAVVSGGGGGGGAGALTAVEDTQVSSVADENLIVVGGSCVNVAAAKILGSDNPVCGADFTKATQVDSAKYIIKTVASPYNSAKIAVLVAGFEAVDTVNAVNTLLNDKPSTDVGTSQVYPIASTTTPATTTSP